MLLALALYASTFHAGIPARSGGTPGVANENTPRYDLDVVPRREGAGRTNASSFGCPRLPAAHTPACTSASANLKIAARPRSARGGPSKARMTRGENLPSAPE